MRVQRSGLVAIEGDRKGGGGPPPGCSDSHPNTGPGPCPPSADRTSPTRGRPFLCRLLSRRRCLSTTLSGIPVARTGPRLIQEELRLSPVGEPFGNPTAIAEQGRTAEPGPPRCGLELNRLRRVRAVRRRVDSHLPASSAHEGGSHLLTDKGPLTTQGLSDPWAKGSCHATMLRVGWRRPGPPWGKTRGIAGPVLLSQRRPWRPQRTRQTISGNGAPRVEFVMTKRPAGWDTAVRRGGQARDPLVLGSGCPLF